MPFEGHPWYGAKARDRVTGFTGIITARFEYAAGCVRFEIESGGEEPGKNSAQALAVDEARIDILDLDVVEIMPGQETRELAVAVGGPPRPRERR